MSTTAAEQKLLALLPATTKELSPVQKGWLQFALNKETTFADLVKDELAIQAKISKDKVEALVKTEGKTKEQLDKDLTALQVLIKESRVIKDKSQDQRTQFTNKIKEKVIEPAMLYEKRSEELIVNAANSELKLRQHIVSLNEAGDKVEKEKTTFKAHVDNEYFRIAAEYRLLLSAFVTDSYKEALIQKQPLDQIEAYKASIKKFLTEIQVPKFVAMPLLHLTKEAAMIIFKSVTAYDSKKTLKTYVDSVDETFKTYSQDLANASKAIVAIEKTAAIEKQEVENSIAVETATNNLVSNAATFTSTGGPTITRKYEIEEENNDKWAFAVIAAFSKNAPIAKTKLRVKTWSKLTIGQMADALGKMATEDNTISFSNLTLKEIQK